jgi:hypothetical protein
MENKITVPTNFVYDWTNEEANINPLPTIAQHRHYRSSFTGKLHQECPIKGLCFEFDVDMRKWKLSYASQSYMYVDYCPNCGKLL